jgi:ubiquinone/menaquinone biosynthesis C-methylase UbiE
MRREESPAKARVSQREAAALYDKLSRVYNLFGHLAESKARKRSLDLADIKPGQHVLEVAVGTGLAFLVRRFSGRGQAAPLSFPLAVR